MSTNIIDIADKVINTRVDAIAAAWLAAKEDEKRANQIRVELEKELIKIVGAKDEGSQTSKTDRYKITTTARVSRKLNFVEYEKIKALIPEKLRPVEFKPEIKQSKIKYLQNNEPEYYKIMCQAMTSTEGKTGVTVEVIE